MSIILLLFLNQVYFIFCLFCYFFPKVFDTLITIRCVLAAVLGMATVLWYSLFGGAISDEEIEHQVRAKLAAKATKRRFFGILPPPKKKE